VKKCPQCGREYSGGITVCPIDDQALVSFVPPIESLTPRKQAETGLTTTPWELSRDERYRHLAIAWGIAFVVFAINHHGNLFAAILYFPLPAYILLSFGALLLGFGGLPLDPVSVVGLGWIVYVSLSGLILLARKRLVYYSLYLGLCLLLLLNVIA
jgi:hypothetical protein